MYCVTRVNPDTPKETQYAIYIKPVNIDTLYVSPFDESIYELNAIVD